MNRMVKKLMGVVTAFSLTLGSFFNARALQVPASTTLGGNLNLNEFAPGDRTQDAENMNSFFFATPQTYYVSTNGNDSNVGSATSPWRTIQRAADVMVAGDTVYIMDGTYGTVVTRRSGAAGAYISFRAYPDGNSTKPVIDGQFGGSHGFTITHNYIEIDGLEIMNAGNAVWKRGVSVSGSYARILNIDTHNNWNEGIGVYGPAEHTFIQGVRAYENGRGGLSGSEGSGHGIIVYQGTNYTEVRGNFLYDNGSFPGQYASGIEVCFGNNVLIKGNQMWGNDQHGIDICGSSSGTIIEDNVVFQNNLVGIALDNGISNTIVRRNVVYANKNGFGGGIYSWLSTVNSQIYNNTVYGNSGYGIGIEDGQTSGQVIRNNILWGNAKGELYVNSTGNLASEDYNDFGTKPIYYAGKSYTLAGYKTASGKGQHSISVDPGFVNQATFDFRLSANSLLIDAGDPANPGQVVIYGSAPDIGAYEYPGQAQVTSTPLVTPTATFTPTVTATNTPMPTSTATATLPPTYTPTPIAPAAPATPIASTGFDFVANACTAYWFSAASSTTLPCPGTDGDARGFVLITNSSKLENGTIDPRPGLITFPQNVNNGYIQGIYPPYKVKAGDRFRSVVTCEEGATSCYVVFRLDYMLSGSSTITTYWAFVEKYEGQSYSADIDLGSLVGQDVNFILTVLSVGSPTGDRALWVAPMIYNTASASPSPTATLALATKTATPTPMFTGTNPPIATSTPLPAATAMPTPTPTSIPLTATPTAFPAPINPTSTSTPNPFTATPTASPVPPTSTTIPFTATPTASPVPPTSTPIPFTPTPTASPVPPTSTPIPFTPTPTASPVPPTSTPIPSTPASQPTIQPPQETVYDDKNGAFIYSSDWEDIRKRSAYNGSYKLTNANGSSVTLTFTGQSFSILYSSGPKFSSMDIYLDGVLVGSLNQESSKLRFQQRWDYTGQLTAGNHTLNLVYTGSRNTRASLDAVIIR